MKQFNMDAQRRRMIVDLLKKISSLVHPQKFSVIWDSGKLIWRDPPHKTEVFLWTDFQRLLGTIMYALGCATDKNRQMRINLLNLVLAGLPEDDVKAALSICQEMVIDREQSLKSKSLEVRKKWFLDS